MIIYSSHTSYILTIIIPCLLSFNKKNKTDNKGEYCALFCKNIHYTDQGSLNYVNESNNYINENPVIIPQKPCNKTSSERLQQVNKFSRPSQDLFYDK